MRVLMTMLIFAGVFCMLSAITGVQSFHYDSRTGSVITHHQGYGRMYAVASAVFCAVAFYGIYRRYPLAWKLGWVALGAGAASFLIEALPSAMHQPQGSAIASTAIVLGAIAVMVYWGFWWRRQRSYFISEDDKKV